MSGHANNGSDYVEKIDVDSLFLTQQQQQQQLNQQEQLTTRKPHHRNRNISFKVLDRRKLINRQRQHNQQNHQQHQVRALSPIGMAYTPVATPSPTFISDQIQQYQMTSASSYPSLKRISSNSLPHIFEDDDYPFDGEEVKNL